MVNEENAMDSTVDVVGSKAEEEQMKPEDKSAIVNTQEDMSGAETDINISKQLINLQAEKSVIDAREAELKKREEELNVREKTVSEREVNVIRRESEVAKAELTQEADLAKEKLAKKMELDEELSKERTAALGKISEMISSRREELENIFTSEIEQRRIQAGKDAEAIRIRAQEDADRIKSEAEQEARERRERLNASTDADIAEKNRAFDARNDELQRKINEYDTKLRELEEAQKKAEESRENAERQKRRNERREESIESREADLDSLIEERWGDKVKEFKAIIAEKDKTLEELRSRASELSRSVDAIENFKASIGDEPAIIQDRISRLQKERDRLEAELANRAPQDIQKELDGLKRDYEELKVKSEALRQENSDMKKSQEGLDAVTVEKHRVEALNSELKSQVEELTGQVARYEDRIKRLSTAETRTADRDARIAEIRSGYTEGFEVTSALYDGEEVNWLDNIGQQCDRYGISFPRRILYAFHTALKISDWSTIAVLAGVSGTGKSELPKLYAAFGGMNFISVPVQPSWDSQESMLGFFNSIDNRFEPEPLLKYLAQCTEDNHYNPYMSIVLLDEMNLAHVEHYFAEFLSKLETRRGTAKNVPTVEVKLGAGVDPYELQLKRTVLWTGTMNQDETTKSLSDKVLDRGLVIYFPRPHTLISRTTLKNLAVLIKDRQMLTESKWTGWIIRNLITGTGANSPLLSELDEYRKIVEDINDILEKVGRALGHRVWQSIMNYILNYPTVSEVLRRCGQREEKKRTWYFDSVEVTEELKSNMRTAFEDQIVQKIMPKLRGIETRGKGRDHLQEIEDLLESKGFEKLKDDFEIACTQGYGQFIWSSAKYIETDDIKDDEHLHVASDVGSSEA